MKRPLLTLLLAMSLLVSEVHANNLTPGISFQHKDWELACDNTRTCRAAGYQSDDDDLALSVLLTRLAKTTRNKPWTDHGYQLIITRSRIF